MPAEWTGVLIGKMHNANVTYDDIAEESGWKKTYISMILNGHRSPKGAEERLYTAFQRVIEKRGV